LNGLKQIAETKKFTILMPTIVLTELTGLAQPPTHGNSSNNASSSAPQQQPGEDEWVGPQARAAIAYLKQQEGLKNSSFQTLTTRGNRLPSFMFAVEQSTEPGEAKKVILHWFKAHFFL